MGRLIFSAQEALDPQTPTKTKGEIRPRTELLHNPGQTGPISTYARQLRPLSCHINSQTWSRRVVACGDFDFKHQFASPRGFYSEIDFKHPKASKAVKDGGGSFRAIEEKNRSYRGSGLIKVTDGQDVMDGMFMGEK